ncbi:hypothetical protein KJA17_01475 [Patescibacteria group bacterium]|nr:hypothetical protein [Patescibacteria group bacterium]
MADQNKILKYLIWGLVLAGIVILVNSWFLKPKPLPPPPILTFHPAIKIDFEILGSQDIQDLLPFEKIPFPEEIGRENPFMPY